MGRGIIGLGGRLIVDGEDGRMRRNWRDIGEELENLWTLDEMRLESVGIVKLRRMRLDTLNGLHGFSCGEDV